MGHKPVTPPPPGGNGGGGGQTFDPNDPFQIPNFAPQHGQPDPRDASYWTNVNRLLYNARTSYAQNQQSQSYANTDYARNQLAQTLAQQRSERTLGERAMKAGLSYSGYLDRSGAELTGDYVLQQSDLVTNKFRDDAARAAARQALVQGLSMDAAAEYAQAAARAADAQVQQAQTGTAEMTPKDVRQLTKALRRRIGRHR